MGWETDVDSEMAASWNSEGDFGAGMRGEDGDGVADAVRKSMQRARIIEIKILLTRSILMLV